MPPTDRSPVAAHLRRYAESKPIFRAWVVQGTEFVTTGRLRAAAARIRLAGLRASLACPERECVGENRREL